MAPGFTYSRETYVIGAYALLQKSVIRFTSLPPNQIVESIKSGSEARYARQVRFDQWRGMHLYCLYGTEVTPNTSVPEEPLLLFWSVVPISTIHAFAHLRSTTTIGTDVHAGACPSEQYLQQRAQPVPA